jgi:uncharacterized BrkB/YihY/UPF0761 family membrane protein
VGSIIAFDLIPATSSTLSILGALGVFLIWLYYLGIVVVAAPTVFAAIAGATRNLMQR